MKYSPDITTVLGGITVYDEEVADDDLAGGVALVNMGTIPAASDANAYHLERNGDHLLSFDTTISLSGGLTAEPRDVVRFNGTTFLLEFNGSTAGVPSGVMVDAVTRDPSSTDLLLSFDTTVELVAASGTITVDDEDLVRFDGSVFSSTFDGSGAGVPAGLDVDGAHLLGGGTLAVSLDGSGTLGGVSFDDEDVLEYDPLAGAWGMAYDASTHHAGWAGADLVAVHAEAVPACMDGIDNDGDGDIDYHFDSGCTDYRDESEHPQCSDGIENEWDGLIDYPDDPDCASPSGVTEAPPFNIVCGLGVELALLLPPLMWMWRRRRG